MKTYFIFLLSLLTVLVTLSKPSISFGGPTCDPIFRSHQRITSQIWRFENASKSIFQFGKDQGIPLEKEVWDLKITQLLKNTKRRNWFIKIGKLVDTLQFEIPSLTSEEKASIFNSQNTLESKDFNTSTEIKYLQMIFNYTNLQISFFLTSNVQGIEPNLAEVHEKFAMSFENDLDSVLLKLNPNNQLLVNQVAYNQMKRFNTRFLTLSNLSWERQSTPLALEKMYRDNGYKGVFNVEGYNLFSAIHEGLINTRVYSHYLNNYDYQTLILPVPVTSKIDLKFPILKTHDTDVVLLESQGLPIFSVQYIPTLEGPTAILRTYDQKQQTLASETFPVPENTKFHHLFYFDTKIYIWTAEKELLALDPKNLEILHRKTLSFLVDVFSKNGKLFLLTQEKPDVSTYQLTIVDSNLNDTNLTLNIPAGNDELLITFSKKLSESDQVSLNIQLQNPSTTRTFKYNLKTLLAGKLDPDHVITVSTPPRPSRTQKLFGAMKSLFHIIW